MGNLLHNAGFLEGTDGWSKSAALAFAVDESTRGAPGRHALVASGLTSAPNQFLALVSPVTAVAGNGWVEAYGSVFSFGTPYFAVEWSGSGGYISATTIPVTPAQMTTYGEAVLGLRETYARGYRRMQAPATATSATLVLGVAPAASGSGVGLAILKPYLGLVAGATGAPTPWDPGVHEEDGLMLPCWPSILRPFRAGSMGEPGAVRTEFASGSGVPATRRTGTVPRKKLKAQIRCDAVQATALDDFFNAAHPAFWVVDPESERLCVGRWAAGGEPRVVENRGVTNVIEVGLHLEIA